MTAPTRTSILIILMVSLLQTAAITPLSAETRPIDQDRSPSSLAVYPTTTTSTGSYEMAAPRQMLSDRSLVILTGMGALAWAGKSHENADRTATVLDGGPFEGLIDLGDAYGGGQLLVAGTLALLAAGRGDERLGAAGKDLARSLLMSGAAVWTLKLGVDARRPDGGEYSFPSGHTAIAFAAAPVLTRHFGKKVGVAAYTLAASTALGRMEDRRHYLADVLFGAAIGLVAGYESCSWGEERGHLNRLFLSPIGPGLGIRLW